MDINLTQDLEMRVSYRRFAEVLCASTESEAAHHHPLSISSMFVNGESAGFSCSSDYLMERAVVKEAFLGTFGNAVLGMRGVGPVDLDDMPSSDLLGYYRIVVYDPDYGPLDGLGYMRRLSLMLDSLRSVVCAWAHHRHRWVLTGLHEGEYSGMGEGMFLDLHMHVIYQRMSGDPPSLMQQEIMRPLMDGCTWYAVDTALGIYPSDRPVPVADASVGWGDAARAKAVAKSLVADGVSDVSTDIDDVRQILDGGVGPEEGDLGYDEVDDESDEVYGDLFYEEDMPDDEIPFGDEADFFPEEDEDIPFEMFAGPDDDDIP